MAALPEEQREVVLMRFVDDMSVEETAKALEIAEGTVKSRLSRGRTMLKNLFNQRMEGSLNEKPQLQ
jgi:RNA polymerase sigma-70 factor (ECF subfamily)